MYITYEWFHNKVGFYDAIKYYGPFRNELENIISKWDSPDEIENENTIELIDEIFGYISKTRINS